MIFAIAAALWNIANRFVVLKSGWNNVVNAEKHCIVFEYRLKVLVVIKHSLGVDLYCRVSDLDLAANIVDQFQYGEKIKLFISYQRTSLTASAIAS